MAANKGMSVMQQGSEEYAINDPNVANEFSTSTSYVKGQCVNYQGKLYRFTTDHAAGSWNSGDVELCLVTEIIREQGESLDGEIQKQSKKLSETVTMDEYLNDTAPYFPIIWESGDVSSSTGQDVADDTFIRTNYIPAEILRGKTFTRGGSYTLYAVTYKADKGKYGNTSYTSDGTFSFDFAAKYVRLSMKKENDGLLAIPALDVTYPKWQREVDSLKDDNLIDFQIKWENGDIDAYGQETSSDSLIRSNRIPADLVSGVNFKLNGNYTLYYYTYYENGEYINRGSVSSDGYLNIYGSADYVRFVINKAYRGYLEIGNLLEWLPPWRRMKIDVDQFKDLRTNVLYYREHIKVSGTANIVSKLIYRMVISSASASVYTLHCDECVGYAYGGYLWAFQYDDQGNEISSHHNVTAGDDLNVTVADGCEYIEFWLRPAYGTALTTGQADYYGVRIFPGTEESYELTGRTNELIRNSAESGGLTIPEYYLKNDYLKNKIARINSLYRATAANGDAFIVISDEHWEHPKCNTQNSPSLINYVWRNTDVQRLFSLGDNADQGSEDYSQKLRDAFGGKIYHVAGNHEYIYGPESREQELYAMWDAYNNDQIGNNTRHYYYVDNLQQKLRYVILNAYKPSGSTETAAAQSGYETEQLTWMSNVAFNVEAGWSIIIFTHGLWTFNPEGTSMYISSAGNAQALLDAIDAYDGDGEIIGLFLGHEHLDRMTRTPVKNIPAFIQASDANTVTQAYGEDPRTAGTKGEQAFDVAILNKTTRTWRLVRIGMKAHDGTNNSWGNEVEERTMTY